MWEISAALWMGNSSGSILRKDILCTAKKGNAGAGQEKGTIIIIY